MKTITSRTELRWALEDMGDAGRPLLEYIQHVLEYADALCNIALAKAEYQTMTYWIEDLEDTAREYKQC